MLQQRYGRPVTLVAFTLETGQLRVNRRYAGITLLCRNNKSPRVPLCPGQPRPRGASTDQTAEPAAPAEPPAIS